MIRSVFATIIFVAVTIVASIVSVPAALLDRSGRAYLWIARIWGKIFFLLYGVKLKVTGQHNIKKNEHYVFVANHASYADVPIVVGAIPADIRMFFRHTLTRIPFWGWSLPASPMIMVDRSNPSKAKKSLLHAIERIHKGASVLLFAEGTRTPTGELQPFKRGAFHIAYASGAKIIPVAIKGSYEIMPRTSNLPASNKPIRVSIGAPLEASTEFGNDRDRELDLMHRAEAAVREMLA